MKINDVRYVRFASASSESESFKIQLFLNRAGVDFVTRNRNPGFYFGGSYSRGINPIAGPIEFMVRADELEAAIAAAQDAFEIHYGEIPKECPACGGINKNMTIDCPECGLFLA